MAERFASIPSDVGNTDVAPRSGSVGDPPENDEVVYIGKTTALGPAVLIQRGRFGHPLRLGEAATAGGYSWGWAGIAPRELSRAILVDATENEMLAERLCRPLTWEVIGRLPPDGFRLGRSEVLAWIENYQFEDAAAMVHH